MKSTTPKRTAEEIEKLRRIPSVESLLSSPAGIEMTDRYGRKPVLEEIRERLEELRRHAIQWKKEAFFETVEERLREKARPSLRPLVNATGVLIHTNMGRTPLSPSIWEAATELMSSYSNLELDEETGGRGSRQHHLSRTCRELFGAPAAILVNNNAAAVLLVLSSLSRDRQVIVSRGELVEIGGSFRIPDVIEQGGAILREVGTTNRTRTDDYRSAISPQTGALLSVHQSNFRIVGFSEAPDDRELAGLATENGIPFVVDEGSGRVVPLEKWGFQPAPTIRELAAIADVVTCSTDKLIGASQGGLILGDAALIEQCARNPLMRALRPGKESIAIITAVLDSFLRGSHEREIPLYQMLEMTLEQLQQRGERIVRESGAKASVVPSEAKLGGGTTPEETTGSIAIAIDGPAEELKRGLLKNDVMGRITEDQLLLDLRTVGPEQDERLIQALRELGGAE